MTYSFLQPNSTSIKICGLVDEDMVDFAVGAGAHAIGFVFVEHSPRYIHRDEAEQLLLQLPDDVVGVAVLHDSPMLHSFANWKGWLQLCGDEDEQMVANAPRPVIKAIQWDREEVLRWDGCENLSAILVDGSSGGLGKTFDVSELAEIIPLLQTPIIIAGGLTPANVQEVIRVSRPAGVDVSSGVESELGIKDAEKVFDFIQKVQDTD